jgi:hypothetical protein
VKEPVPHRLIHAGAEGHPLRSEGFGLALQVAHLAAELLDAVLSILACSSH